MSTPKRRKKKAAKRLLALPELEHAKIAVLNSLTSASGQRTYEYAIWEFVAWYCSEPRLAFNRTVVLRYRIHLEQRRYAPATINLRLAAVRRIAYEAADAGLLSPELAAGIRRVEGVRRPPPLRDGRAPARGGLQRGEALGLALESIQQREEDWVIADLVGKGGLIRNRRRRLDPSRGADTRARLPRDQQGGPGLGRREDSQSALGRGSSCGRPCRD
jgi:hypothetical protein